VRQWLAERRRRRQRDSHDPFASGRLKRLRPTSADFWVQTLKPVLVEGMDHSPHVRLIGVADQRDLVHGRVHHRRHQNLRALSERLTARLAQVRQELHLALLQRSNKQRRSGHASSSVTLIFTNPRPSPEAPIPVNISRTQH